jgi:hypothetical protein
MWYRGAKIVVAQGLNVVGPAMPTPEMPMIPAPAPMAPAPGMAPPNVQESPSDIPLGAALPPLESAQNPFPEPPLHDRCHCRIKTMPGGRKIWEFSANACPTCRQVGEAFNAYQASLFGV